MTIDVVGLGAGGQCGVVLEALQLRGGCNVVGLLDADPRRHGQEIDGVQILGGDDALPGLFAQGLRHFFVGLGSTSTLKPRQALYEYACSLGFEPVSVIHPTAIVSPSAELGRSAMLLAGAIVGTHARLGENALVNTGAIVEHDCDIGSHIHVATGARLAGGVRVGDKCHIGVGSTILQGVRIGRGSVVGAGSVVLKDVPESVVVVGVPARILRKVAES